MILDVEHSMLTHDPINKMLNNCLNHSQVQDEEKVSNVQSLFGVSDSEAAALKKTVDSGGLKWADEAQKEDEIFF